MRARAGARLCVGKKETSDGQQSENPSTGRGWDEQGDEKCARHLRDSHVILDGVQTSEHQVEDAHLRAAAQLSILQT